MRRWTTVIASVSLAGVLALLALTPGAGSALAARAPAGPPELKKLHALLVFDTNSSLEPELRIDRARVSNLFTQNVPRDRLDLKVLTGKQVTRDSILGYYRSVKAGPDDALLFFYGGHGGRTEAGQLFLALDSERRQPFYRSELRKAMLARKAALTVILTDCCSNPVKLPRPAQPKEEPVTAKVAEELSGVFRCLLFQARGTVDITAATNDVAYGDEEKGGLFTLSFCKLMARPLSSLDSNHDHLLSWAEFFPALQKETEQAFQTWSEEMRRRGEAVNTKQQKPEALALGQPEKAGPVTTGGPAGPVIKPAEGKAVVGIANLAPRAVSFRYRWEGEDRWQSVRLVPGARLVKWTGLSGRKALPALEVEFSSVKAPPRLASAAFTGKGQPTFADGKHYNLRVRKGASRDAEGEIGLELR